MEGNRNGNGGYPLKCLCGAVTPLKCLCGAVTLKTPWTHNLVARSSSEGDSHFCKECSNPFGKPQREPPKPDNHRCSGASSGIRNGGH